MALFVGHFQMLRNHCDESDSEYACRISAEGGWTSVTETGRVCYVPECSCSICHHVKHWGWFSKKQHHLLHSIPLPGSKFHFLQLAYSFHHHHVFTQVLYICAHPIGTPTSFACSVLSFVSTCCFRVFLCFARLCGYSIHFSYFSMS